MRKLKLAELGRLTPELYRNKTKIPLCLILDDIRSGMNVGSFFRTADAFRIEKIYLCGITSVPPHKEILKTAIGATDTVEWEYCKNIVELISQLNKDHKVIGVEQTDGSTALHEFTVSTDARYALVFGNEVNGISEDCLPYLQGAVEIPQFGTKHSLNVSVCGGIVLWHFAVPFLGSVLR